MNNLIISNFPIGPKFNGGAMTVWGLTKFFLENNKNLTLFLICSYEKKKTDQYKECISILNENNLNYKIFFYDEIKLNPLKKLYKLCISLIYGYPDFFFPHHSILKKQIEKKIQELNYDQITCYHFDALSSCYGIKNLNLLLGDFIHEPRIHRRLIIKNNFISRLINFFETIIGFRVMKKLTKESNFIGFFSKKYADIFNKKIKKSEYIKTPIVEVSKYSLNIESHSNLNFLLIGHLAGTVTISSLIFLEKVIKKYEKKLISIDAKFDIVGGNILNQKNKYLLSKNQLVKFHGESFNISNFFDQSQFLLVPNEIDLGIRVRIITGLSFGAIILTHISNSKAIPELQDHYNCLFFSDEHELMEIFFKLKNNKIDTKVIKQNAINTFYENFYFKNSVAEIYEKISNN